MEVISHHQCFGGMLGYYRHDSVATRCPMRFSLFTPPNTKQTDKLPTLFFLSGLTCTEENFTVKAGAYRMAAELGLIIIAPDTSPRGEGVPTGDGDDLGFGAGFYVDATQTQWKKNYQMETYITDELYKLVQKEFPVDADRIGIFGHSMGGHGALTLFLKHPGLYRSVSAFAPICSPTQSNWGGRVFAEYLGPDKEEWKKHDASELMRSQGPVSQPILIDQGTADKAIERLHPHLFAEACAAVGQQLQMRRQEGYDHGYFFIQTFIEDHLRFHAAQLA